MSTEILSSTLPELITFLVRALWSPTKATLINAIDHGLLSTWPQLTSANVRKYLPKQIATTLGHMAQRRKNLRSTRISDKEDITEDQEPDPESIKERMHNTFLPSMT